MKKKIYILLTAALAVLAGCIHDKQWETPAADADADAGSVTLNIALPAPVVQDMGRTRGVSDFDNFKNINIILAAGAAEPSTILHTIYVELDNAATTLPAGIEYSLRGGNYGLHFSKEWFRNSGMDPAGITFIVVANYGSQISEPTVGALRSHKYVSPEPGSPGNNVMYGESDIYEGNTPVHTNPDLDHAGGRTLKVDLTQPSR